VFDRDLAPVSSGILAVEGQAHDQHKQANPCAQEFQNGAGCPADPINKTYHAGVSCPFPLSKNLTSPVLLMRRLLPMRIGSPSPRRSPRPAEDGASVRAPRLSPRSNCCARPAFSPCSIPKPRAASAQASPTPRIDDLRRQLKEASLMRLYGGIACPWIGHAGTTTSKVIDRVGRVLGQGLRLECSANLRTSNWCA
jgi:hypothetical protein